VADTDTASVLGLPYLVGQVSLKPSRAAGHIGTSEVRLVRLVKTTLPALLGIMVIVTIISNTSIVLFFLIAVRLTERSL